MSVAVELTGQIRHIDNVDWQFIEGEEGRSDAIRWKTLTGATDATTAGITSGVCEVPPGAKLPTHSHAEHEIYYITAGRGEVLLGDEIHRVEPGSVLFIPGATVHGIRNCGSETLALTWIFAVDAWSQVEYHMVDSNF